MGKVIQLFDRVRMKVNNRYVFGTVTIAEKDRCKVLFDDQYDVNYDFYPRNELEYVEFSLR